MAITPFWLSTDEVLTTIEVGLRYMFRNTLKHYNHRRTGQLIRARDFSPPNETRPYAYGNNTTLMRFELWLTFLL